MAELSLNSVKNQNNHTHTKSQITDFPTSLPANGGNADTLDGYHISDIQAMVSSGFDVGHSFSSNGYQKMSNGLIIQWGYGTTTSTAAQNNTFPIAFPNACLTIVGTLAEQNSMTYNLNFTNITTTAFCARRGNGGDVNSYKYIAIGY